MCWAACDRLARIAAHLRIADRAKLWRERADYIRNVILERSWSEKRKSFVESFGGEHLDASVLLMSEVGLVDAKDERFQSTLDVVGKVLGRGPYMMRYEAPDDFGMPKTAFNVCAFWRVDALSRVGRREEAREIFEALLETRNHLGLMSEDTDPTSREAWGNFPQTYSMVGIINGAVRLSRPWEGVV
jgi:GH15 family glucan-1,4-alpha-glucosidase